MAKEYQILLDPSMEGNRLKLKEFPDLEVFYLKSGNPLTLLVNNQEITLGLSPSVVDNYQLSARRVVTDTSGKRYQIIAVEMTPPEVHYLGQIFTLQLPENPSTGYVWQVTTSPGLQIIDSSFSNTCETKVVGCGGTRTWKLRGIAVGEQSFVGRYLRPWEKEVVSPRVIKFQII